MLHLFLGEEIKDIEVTKSLVKKVAGNFRLPYFTVTPTFSVCPSHGYISGEHATCDKCDSDTEIYSRVVGYLRPVHQWNDGKQAEFCMRKTFRFNNQADDQPRHKTVSKADDQEEIIIADPPARESKAGAA